MSEEAILFFSGLTLVLGGGLAIYLLVTHRGIIRDPGSFAPQAGYPPAERLSEHRVSARPKLRLIVPPEAHRDERPLYLDQERTAYAKPRISSAEREVSGVSDPAAVP